METILLYDKEGINDIKTKEDLEQYIGIQYDFVNPYHLFLHRDDMNNSISSIIRFIVWSAGAKKILMTGIYRKNNSKDKFRIIYACKYFVKDISFYTKEWSQNFEIAVTTMKNRSTSLIDAFLDKESPPYLRSRDHYIQLKAYLTIQPRSIFYDHKKDIDKIKMAITPEYMQLLKSNILQFTIISNLTAHMSIISLTGEDISDIKEDVEELHTSIISILDSQLDNYEKTLNTNQVFTNEKYILDITKEFYHWISRSEYVNQSWYKSLQPCDCTEDNPTGEGCRVIRWGNDISLV